MSSLSPQDSDSATSPAAGCVSRLKLLLPTVPLNLKNPGCFTSAELLTNPTLVGKRTLPLYLAQPEVIFRRIWASPADDRFLNLAD